MADELMTQPPPKHIRLASHNIERDLTEAVIFAAAFRFCSLAKKEKENLYVGLTLCFLSHRSPPAIYYLHSTPYLERANSALTGPLLDHKGNSNTPRALLSLDCEANSATNPRIDSLDCAAPSR